MNGLDIFYCVIIGIFGILTAISIGRYVKEKEERFLNVMIIGIGSIIGTLIAWLFLPTFSWKIVVIILIAMGILSVIYDKILSEYTIGRLFCKVCETYASLYLLTHLIKWLFG